jgi:hypothetical protein
MVTWRQHRPHDSLKFFASYKPADNRFGKGRAALNPIFMTSGASFSHEKGARVSMPILNEIAVAASVLLALLFVSSLFGPPEGNARFEASLYESTTYTSRAEQAAAAELRFARGATPADRVNDVFARFGPGDARRGKRYSSIAGIIQ